MTPKEVLAYCRKKDVKAVDLRYSDLFGTWRHLTLPVDKLREEIFEDGVGFDGSSVRGWQAVHESDLVLIPGPETCFVDPFLTPITLAMICNVVDPTRRDDYAKDPRYIAHKSENFLVRTSIADSACFAAETEFHVHDEPTVHHRPMSEDSPFAADPWMNLRNEMMQAMVECGMDVESHRPIAADRCCIDLRFQKLVKMADSVMMCKYIVSSLGRKHGKSINFASKHEAGQIGDSMQIHFSLWKNGEPIFSGNQYGGLSEAGMFAIGGILRHMPSVMAFTNTHRFFGPSANPKCPIRISYGQRNRSVACRIPQYSDNPRSKRIEIRFPDAGCNPYLAFAAILMAAIDGIQNKLSPRAPTEEDISTLTSETRDGLPLSPASLSDSLGTLEKDHEFLLRGDVFTRELIDRWIQLNSM